MGLENFQRAMLVTAALTQHSHRPKYVRNHRVPDQSLKARAADLLRTILTAVHCRPELDSLNVTTLRAFLHQLMLLDRSVTDNGTVAD